MNCITVEVGSYLVTNCYIVYDGADCAVVDPGFQPEIIIKKLEELSLVPTHMLLTHGHPDHVGGVAQLKKRYGCLVAMGEKDIPWARFAPDIPLVGGETVTVGRLEFSVIATPGHTLGGVCYHCGDMLFTGDTLFCEDVGRTDFEGGDYDTLMDSISLLRDLPFDAAVLPGHEESSTLAAERVNNRYMRR